MSLTDRFGRRITYLRISVTDRCNLRCQYCLPASGGIFSNRDSILTYEEVARVAGELVRLGVRKIRLTGGEPLVRSELWRLVEMLAGLAGVEDLALSTNGMLLARHARRLRSAGLKRVNVSLDTLNAARFRAVTRLGEVADVLAGIEEALCAGLAPVKINAVLMRGINDDEIVDLARLSLSRPLQVRFIELMPFGSARSEFNYEERFFSAAEALRILEGLEAVEPAGALGCAGPARVFRYPGAAGTVGFISPVTNPFCQTCNRVRLTARGMLRPCLDDQNAVDLRRALRSNGGDDELRRLILKAVAEKPEAHHMGLGERLSLREREPLCSVGG